MEQALLQKQLEHFLDSQGRLTAFPAKRKRKLYALAYLAGQLAPGTRYTEQQLNGLLEQWHTFRDPATLRRELFTNRFLDRERDGSAYWLAENSPELPE